MMDDILLTLQMGCSVRLDPRQAVRLGGFIKKLQDERDAHAANTALVAKLNEYCQANKIGDWGGSAVESVIKHVATLRAEREALRKALIEYDDCDTASQSKLACKAMVDLAKGVK